MIRWFTHKPAPTASDAARTLAKQGEEQRRAKIIATMNILREQMGMLRFEVRS